MWWKLNIQFAETELLFVNRLLNSSAFEQHIPNLIERLKKFKQKEDVNNHYSKMQNRAECENLFCDAVYLKNHDILEIHFE